ncbi:MAG: phosphoserine aminotransferase, partial [Alphaproteobacteria bacterium]
SMLCVEDAIDGLVWAESIGGLPALIQRSEANLAAIRAWVDHTPWVEFLANQPSTISCTSICLKIVDGWYLALDAKAQEKVAKDMVALLEKEKIAYDIGAYRDAPSGLRIWGGATVETKDIEALLPWLDWAWAEVKQLADKAA